jgi:hypothetical protein
MGASYNSGQGGGKSMGGSQPGGPSMGSQQPITQGTGQLPPGFGELSPIDRSQISPDASMGFGMSPMQQPMPSGGMGGGKSATPLQDLFGGTANRLGNVVAPALDNMAPGLSAGIGQQLGNVMAPGMGLPQPGQPGGKGGAPMPQPGYPGGPLTDANDQFIQGPGDPFSPENRARIAAHEQNMYNMGVRAGPGAQPTPMPQPVNRYAPPAAPVVRPQPAPGNPLNNFITQQQPIAGQSLPGIQPTEALNRYLAQTAPVAQPAPRAGIPVQQARTVQPTAYRPQPINQFTRTRAPRSR